MNTFEFFMLLIFIGIIIIASQIQKKKEYNNKVEEIKQRDVSYSQYGNKSILNSMDEESFIKYFGKDQLDQIKNGTDTEIVKML